MINITPDYCVSGSNLCVRFSMSSYDFLCLPSSKWMSEYNCHRYPGRNISTIAYNIDGRETEIFMICVRRESLFIVSIISDVCIVAKAAESFAL